MLMWIGFILSFGYAQTNTQTVERLLKNILPEGYDVSISVKSEQSEKMFVPVNNVPGKMYVSRLGTTLSDNQDRIQDSNMIVQSFSDSGNNFALYTAERVGSKDWKLYRLTDGNHNSKNLTYCETEGESQKWVSIKPDLKCIYVSKRVCDKNPWPIKDRLTTQEFKDFLATQKGYEDYEGFSLGQMRRLRDRASNTYKIANFSVQNRIQEASNLKEDMRGQTYRASVLKQMKALCEKAWGGQESQPQNNERRGAPQPGKNPGVI